MVKDFISKIFSKCICFIVFDDVEYAELAFRDAQNLVMYYRQQGQLTKEPIRNRKKTNNRRLKKFKLNNNRHKIGLSSNRSKQIIFPEFFRFSTNKR
jgi:hypothetical protein